MSTASRVGDDARALAPLPGLKFFTRYPYTNH